MIRGFSGFVESWVLEPELYLPSDFFSEEEHVLFSPN